MANYDFTYTGAEIQAILDTANKLKDSGYIFLGVATPSTDPGTPTQKVYYIATTNGTYVNFNNTELPTGISVLKWNGSWSYDVVYVSQHPYGDIFVTGFSFKNYTIAIGNIILIDVVNLKKSITVDDTFTITQPLNSHRLVLNMYTETVYLQQEGSGVYLHDGEILLLYWSGNLRRFVSGALLPYVNSKGVAENSADILALEQSVAIADTKETHIVDTSGGNRNVNYKTGEYETSQTEYNYANEIAIDGTEIRIEYRSSGFSGDYGYAFLDADNNYVYGAKIAGTATVKKTIDYQTIKKAVDNGATKLRLSLYSQNDTEGIGNSVPHEFYVYKGSLADVQKIVEKPEYTGFEYIGTPVPYISDMNIDGITFFGHGLADFRDTTLAEVYAAYDALASQYPDWFVKESNIGTDESNTYEIRHYTLRMQTPLVTNDRWGRNTNMWSDTDFKPKRVILNMGTHCDEPESFLAGYLIVKEILESSEDWALWIKSNLIIDVVPVLSPWSVANGWVGVNVNDININRTFINYQQLENIAFINLVSSLKTKGLVGCVDLHNTNDGYGYLVSKPAYWAWNFYCKITQRLQALTYGICNDIFQNDSMETNRKNHFHTWNATGTGGQLHQYMNQEGLLGATIEVTWRSERFKNSLTMKGVLLEKMLGINLITSFATFNKMIVNL